ncbi:MAG: hypothetical protein ACOCQD_00970 [archaeon]
MHIAGKEINQERKAFKLATYTHALINYIATMIEVLFPIIKKQTI